MSRPCFPRLILCASLFLLAAPPSAALLWAQRSADPGDGQVRLRAELPQASAPAADEPAPHEDEAAPPSIVEVHLWALNVLGSPDQLDDELAVNLGKTATDLPARLASREAVDEFLTRLAAGNAVRHIRKFRLTALAGHSATSQSEAQIPRVTGITRSDFGRNNTVQTKPVGTTVELRPTVAADGQIQVALVYQSSDFKPDPDILIAQPTDGTAIYADVITIRQVKTLVRLRSGTAVVVECQSSTDADDPARASIELLILSAAIVPAE